MHCIFMCVIILQFQVSGRMEQLLNGVFNCVWFWRLGLRHARDAKCPECGKATIYTPKDLSHESRRHKFDAKWG